MSAFVDLELAQADDTSPPGQAQNPTTRGTAGLRSHIVQDGDSLHSIAYESYGDPTRWRTIAEANEIDDPLRSAPRHLLGDSEARHSECVRTAAANTTLRIYTILVGGQAIDPSLAKQIREIKIQSYLRLPDTCTFTSAMRKGRRGGDQPIDENPFDIGQTLEIKLGAADDLTTRSLFKGQIVSLEMNFGAGGVELLCRGFDRSHVLMRSRHAQTFQNMTSSDIVTKIVQAAGFSRTATQAAIHTSSCSRTTRPIGTSSGVSPNGSASSSSSRTRSPTSASPSPTIRSSSNGRRRCVRSAHASPRLQQVQQVTLADTGPEDQAGDLGDGRHSRTRSPRSALTARPSPMRSRLTPMHIATEPVKSNRKGRPSPRRCSTSWPTVTSPPRE